MIGYLERIRSFENCHWESLRELSLVNITVGSRQKKKRRNEETRKRGSEEAEK